MALPTSRNTTYTPGSSEVKGNDLNALQDAIIGGKKASRTRSFFPWLLTGTNIAMAGTVGVDMWWQTSNVGGGYVWLPCEVGDRITGLKINAYGDGVVDCTHTVHKISTAQALASMGSIADLNRAAAWGVVDVLPFTPTVIAAGEGLILQLAYSGLGYRLGNIQLIYDRL
jgi:hypothetical protein